MPAIITHDTFGLEVYHQLFEFIGGSRDEAEAFLLGNQGPDPLFYSVINPRFSKVNRLGSIMHDQHPTELIAAFKASIAHVPEPDRRIARDYTLGFLCHYLLDSTAHPFIFGQQYSFCDAGVPGLTRENGGDVHAVIESELDEVALYTRRDETIGKFNPSKNILHASDHVLDVISKQYEEIARTVYGIAVPADLFAASVKAFRLVQGVFYSPRGIKRAALSRIETLARPYSFYRAMSHRNIALTESVFDNHGHDQWTNPYTDHVSSKSFWDLFEEAKQRAFTELYHFDIPSFSEEDARKITRDLNFSGKRTGAEIVAVETVTAEVQDEL